MVALGIDRILPSHIKELTDSAFAVNPNQWGWEEGSPGSLCLNVRLTFKHSGST